MASTVKVTFTFDPETVERIHQTARRLGVSKSGVVREAVRVYAEHAGQLSAAERAQLLEVFDRVVPRIPPRPAAAADRELAAVRQARRGGGRRPKRKTR